MREKNKNPFILDTRRPIIPLIEFAYKELRYKALTVSHPKEAEELMTLAQEMVNLRWKNYEELAVKRSKRFCACGVNS